jgi:GT2 family glycosyltransferase
MYSDKNKPQLHNATSGSISVDAPHVALIILNWNQPAYTLACLRSLQSITYLNFKVFVLDNGSVDDSLLQIKALLPELSYEIELIPNGCNLGFAEGNNVGIRQALVQGADYVLLLNNDTEVAPNFIELLVDVAERDPKIGITGPKIYYYDDPKRIWSAGGLITKAGWTQQLGVNELDSPAFNQLREVDYVTGCAMLVKREVIEKIGTLDARFFAYYEETDWCARAHKAGYSIWYVPQSVLWHKISLKARDLSPTYVYLMTRNRLLFLRNLGFSPFRVWLSLITVDLRTVVAWSIWKRHRQARSLRQWRLRGMLDYIRGRFGEPRL